MTKINHSNFHHYLLKPWAKDLSKKQQGVMWGCTLTSGVLLLGLPQLGCGIAWGIESSIHKLKNRDVKLTQNPDVSFTKLQTRSSKETTKNFIKYLDETFEPNAEVVRTFIDQGADVNARLPSGRSPLIQIIQSVKHEDRISLVSLFLEKGATVNFHFAELYGTALGATLHHIGSDTIELVQLLLELGANPNLSETTDSGARSPLLYLMEIGRQDRIDLSLPKEQFISLLKLLLDAGADINSKFRGWTPLHYAKVYYPQEVIDLLREHGAKSSPRPPNDEYSVENKEALFLQKEFICWSALLKQYSKNVSLPLQYSGNYCFPESTTPIKTLVTRCNWTKNPRKYNFAFPLSVASSSENELTHRTLVFVDHASRTVELYNSMPNIGNKRAIDTFLNELAQEIGGKDSSYKVDYKITKTLQHDNHNCTFWTYLFIKMRLEHPNPDVHRLKTTDVLKVRQEAKKLLAQAEKAEIKQRRIFLNAYGWEYQQHLNASKERRYQYSSVHPKVAHLHDLLDGNFLQPL